MGTPEDLRVVTGWSKISIIGGTMVFDLREDEIEQVKHLRRTEHGLVLDYPDFQGIPISFFVTSMDGNSVTQYYTLNGTMHRGLDLPSRVTFDLEKDTVESSWFYKDTRHREAGPAVENGKGFNLVDHGIVYWEESWAALNLEWFLDGMSMGRQRPKRAELTQVKRTRRKDTRLLEDPEEGTSALTAKTASFYWCTHEEYGPQSGLSPIKVEFEDLEESYEKGVLKSRSCSSILVVWSLRGEVLSSPDVSEFIRTQMINQIEVWNGPFYPNREAELIILNEFDRCA